MNLIHRLLGKVIPKRRPKINVGQVGRHDNSDLIELLEKATKATENVVESIKLVEDSNKAKKDDPPRARGMSSPIIHYDDPMFIEKPQQDSDLGPKSNIASISPEELKAMIEKAQATGNVTYVDSLSEFEESPEKKTILVMDDGNGRANDVAKSLKDAGHDVEIVGTGHGTSKFALNAAAAAAVNQVLSDPIPPVTPLKTKMIGTIGHKRFEEIMPIRTGNRADRRAEGRTNGKNRGGRTIKGKAY